MQRIVRNILLAIGSILFAGFLVITTVNAASPLTCKTFDTWYLSDGGTKFDYKVVDGKWNFPDDIEEAITGLSTADTVQKDFNGNPIYLTVEDYNESRLDKGSGFVSSVTINNTGIWEYASDQDQAKYFIVFLSFEPSGDPFGQHDICVYRVPYVK